MESKNYNNETHIDEEPPLPEPTIAERHKMQMKYATGHDYRLCKEIGHGSYGQVVLAVHEPTGRRVAIKKIEAVFSSVSDARRTYREIRILRELGYHRNLVQLLDIIPPSDPARFTDLYLVFEAAPSDLRKLYRESFTLEERHIKTIFFNLLCGLKLIHSANVVHRDIKPANLLVYLDCTVKICDFGLARQLGGIFKQEDIFAQHLEGGAMLMGSGSDSSTKGSGSSSRYGSNNSETAETPDQHHQHKGGNTEESKFSGLCLRAAKHANESWLQHLGEDRLSDLLTETLEERYALERQLSCHVATRYYRAPELILMEKDYGKAVDVWAAGVIWGELLKFLRNEAAQADGSNGTSASNRKSLFPGKYCFPLSPNKRAPIDEEGIPLTSAKDQMQLIFDLIGKPTCQETSFITDQKALTYINRFAEQEPADLSELYPDASPEALSLLTEMLRFNPFHRPSVEHLLASPYFDDVRNFSTEVQAKAEISLDVDTTEEYVGLTQIRHMILDEVDAYQAMNLLSGSPLSVSSQQEASQSKTKKQAVSSSSHKTSKIK